MRTEDPEDPDLEIDQRMPFKNAETKFVKWLGEINKVTLFLYRNGVLLSVTSLILYKLLNGIDTPKSNPNSPLYGESWARVAFFQRIES